MSTVAEKKVADKVIDVLEGRLQVGSAIDKLNALREDKRAHEAQIKLIEEQYTNLEERLMEKMGREDIDKATGKTASVSVTSTVNGNVTDWAKVEAYIIKNKYLHFFQRRLSDPALREVWKSGKKIPGVDQFVQKRLNLRSL